MVYSIQYDMEYQTLVVDELYGKGDIKLMHSGQEVTVSI